MIKLYLNYILRLRMSVGIEAEYNILTKFMNEI